MTTRSGLAVVLIAGVALRVLLLAVYEPIHHQDTDTYTPLAASILRADFSSFDGLRPPGYPAFIALAGLSPQRIWLLQMIAGVAISLLLFHIALRLTRRPGVAMFVAITYNANLAQLFFEANLLSETLTTLLVVAACAVLGTGLERMRSGRPETAWLVGAGALAGLAALTRPQFVYLPVLFAAVTGYAVFVISGAPLRRVAGRGLAAVAPGLVLILGWSYVNYVRLDFFTPSTLVGINLMNHTLPFVESAPKRYAPIPEIAARHRDAKIARTGRHNFANFEALPELKAATGLRTPALSKRLEEMSVELIFRHPFRYAWGVAQAWVDFWLAPNYWALDKLKPRSLAPVLRSVWWPEYWLLRAMNAVFLVVAMLALTSRRFRDRVRWELELSGLCAVVLLASLVQAMGEWGENPRYAIPVQALVVLVVLVVGWRWARARAVVGAPAVAEGRQTVAVVSATVLAVGLSALAPPPVAAGGGDVGLATGARRGDVRTIQAAAPSSGVGSWQRLKAGNPGDPTPNSGGFQTWAYNDTDGSIWYYNSSEAGAIYRYDFGPMRWSRTVTNGIARARHNCATVYDRDNEQLYIGGCAPDAQQPEAHRIPTKGPQQGQMLSLAPSRFPVAATPACGYDPGAKVILCFGGWTSSPKVYEHAVVPFSGLGNWVSRTPVGAVPELVAGQPGANSYTRSTYNRGGWSRRHGKLYAIDAPGDLWFYDRGANAWSRTATSGPKPPSYGVVALHDAANVVVTWAGCGFDCAERKDQTYLLDVATGTWSLGPAGAAGPTSATFQSYNILYHEARQSIVLMIYGTPPPMWEFRLPQTRAGIGSARARLAATHALR
jgi:hypothetical protein